MAEELAEVRSESKISRSSTLTGWLLNTNEPALGALAIGSNLGGAYAPKLKFLFTVKFDFRTIINADTGSGDLQSATYDLKTAGRPIITVNYEDVNFYGYRSQVATKITFGTVRLSFYDDSKNRANSLLWNYLEAISPMVKNSVRTNPTSLMNGNESEKLPSSIGNLFDSQEDGPIAMMTVYHHYNNDEGSFVTEHQYTNPKMESIEYDELDMSSSDASILSVVFKFDAAKTITTQLTSYSLPASAVPPVMLPHGEYNSNNRLEI